MISFNIPTVELEDIATTFSHMDGNMLIRTDTDSNELVIVQQNSNQTQLIELNAQINVSNSKEGTKHAEYYLSHNELFSNLLPVISSIDSEYTTIRLSQNSEEDCIDFIVETIGFEIPIIESEDSDINEGLVGDPESNDLEFTLECEFPVSNLQRGIKQMDSDYITLEHKPEQNTVVVKEYTNNKNSRVYDLTPVQISGDNVACESKFNHDQITKLLMTISTTETVTALIGDSYITNIRMDIDSNSYQISKYLTPVTTKSEDTGSSEASEAKAS